MRSYAHMSFTSLPPERENWVLNVLIPQLNNLTGIEWHLDHDLVKSERLFLNISHRDDNVSKHNPILKKLIDLYPTLTERCIGYKVEDEKTGYRGYGDTKRNWPKSKTSCANCWGYWAISIDNIIARGKITGAKFDLS